MDSNAANQKDMASKAHADVHADEMGVHDGETARLNIFGGDSGGGEEVE